MEDQLRRLKAQVDELTRQLTDANGIKARLTTENFELQRQCQDLDSANAALSKAKSQLSAALDDAKRTADDEARVSFTHILIKNVIPLVSRPLYP